MTNARIALMVFALGLTACRGKVAGTATLAGPGTVTTHVVANGPIKVWADTDMPWVGGEHSKPMIEYDLDLKQNGKDAGHVQCSTNDNGGSSICGMTTTINDDHNADCELELGCAFPNLTGDIEVKVTGRTGANVRAVKKMSLNFRAK